MKKILLSLSGGMDSSTLLGILLNDGYQVYCVAFNYGAKHNTWEIEAANRIVEFYQRKGYPAEFLTIDLTQIFLHISSNLLLSGPNIVEGDYKESAKMKSNIVPGRNLIFTSILASMAESLSVGKIASAIQEGEGQSNYPDCRREFIKALDTTVYLSGDRKVELLTPLLGDDKTMVLRKGLKLDIPYHLTRTCYKNQPISCGRCGGCTKRLEAFSDLNVKDPIEYERFDNVLPPTIPI